MFKKGLMSPLFPNLLFINPNFKNTEVIRDELLL